MENFNQAFLFSVVIFLILFNITLTFILLILVILHNIKEKTKEKIKISKTNETFEGTIEKPKYQFPEHMNKEKRYNPDEIQGQFDDFFNQKWFDGCSTSPWFNGCDVIFF